MQLPAKYRLHAILINRHKNFAVKYAHATLLTGTSSLVYLSRNFIEVACNFSEDLSCRRILVQYNAIQYNITLVTRHM